MSFAWPEYLSLAEELAGQATKPTQQEARLRAAISRAYYAAFCQGRNYLRDFEGQKIPSGGRAHQYVRDEFKKSTDAHRIGIGYDLERLRSERNKADYVDNIAMLDALTKTDLVIANRVISTLGKL
jgi:uncharacterized protein (UPF0332 family)